jgi:DNA-binding NtrC family response regulator
VADILVVEDESVIRSALKRLLERNKYRVFEAGSVKEAEDNFKLDRFSLIISDLRLPGAPGTELIRRAGEVPVLIMTSCASLRSPWTRCGWGRWTARPFDHDDLLTPSASCASAAQRLARGRDAARPVSYRRHDRHAPKSWRCTNASARRAHQHLGADPRRDRHRKELVARDHTAPASAPRSRWFRSTAPRSPGL